MDEADREGHEERRGEPVIVCIGASAGGVRALQTFFEQVPEQTGAAFVVIMHLDPERRSELPSVLAARSRIPVVSIDRRLKLRADHVYVMPSDRRLEMTDHEVIPIEFAEPRGQRSPIDQFLRSIAEHLGDGIAIILSGAGSDGTLGVRAVKEAGGIVLVQDPAEAEYNSMPRSAIATGVVDFVLSIETLVARMIELVRMKRGAATAMSLGDEDLVRRILAYLRTRTGHDFSKYKRSTVLRRIARRMQVARTDDLSVYYDVLRDNAEEAQALLGDLLISVTTFFRDSEAFETLNKLVIPRLFHERQSDDPVRVWVSGCATGEEAYSVAMLLIEEASRHDLRPPIQVFGSDLDARALSIAREGLYSAAIETDVPEDRLRRFFMREGDGYRVRQELRNSVLFAVHDLLKDPPFSRVDLISCRNVLIYLGRDLQEQVCSTFHYALNRTGYLLLGSSENADSPSGLFRTIDRNSRIYQSTAYLHEKPRLLPQLIGPLRSHEQVVRFTGSSNPTVTLGDAALHRRAIERAAPPSALVDEGHRVIHLSDNAGRFLQPAGGPLSGDIVDLVRPELRFELRSALHRLFEQQAATLSLPIPVQFNGSAHRVLIEVKAAEENDGGRTALVMFIEGERMDVHAGALGERATDDTVRRLMQELDLTHVRLRTVREESDAANEELRAANEELQSIIEEYRSTSEELETSKEELQSINEELQTVNSELKLNLEAISRAHSDLQNLMAATDFGTLFLDASLRIKLFTEHVTDLFSVTPADEGRPITDFAHRLEYTDLVKDARTVLADLVPVRREVCSRDQHWYDLRMRPYRTVEDKIDGVVITFIDITVSKKVEAALRESERDLLRQKQLVDLARDPIFVWDFEDGITEWNRGSEQLYGYSREEALGKTKPRLLRTEVPGSSFEALRADLAREGNWSGELVQTTKDGRSLMVESRLHLESVDGRWLVLETTRDISERKRWEARQQLLLRELAHRVKNTLTVVQSIARQTLRNTPAPADFMVSFEGRLSALSRAHDLLVQSDWKGADLGALAGVQLEPYASDGGNRLHLNGPTVSLPAELATPFGLVLHELAANAAKYGSLSHSQGSVKLNWSIDSRNDTSLLAVVWQEKSDRPAERFKSVGLGTTLIDNGIPGANVLREFGPEGFVCRITLPLPKVSANEAGIG